MTNRLEQLQIRRLIRQLRQRQGAFNILLVSRLEQSLREDVLSTADAESILTASSGGPSAEPIKAEEPTPAGKVSGKTEAEEAVESARAKLTPNQRALFDAMVSNRLRGTYQELSEVEGGWDVDCPSDHAITLALKELRKRLPKADWWFEISDTHNEYNWKKRPDRER